MFLVVLGSAPTYLVGSIAPARFQPPSLIKTEIRVMSTKQHVTSLLTWVRSMSESMIKDMSESAMLHQNCPTDNHALWTLGHLAATEAWMAGVIGISGVSVPETYAKLFGSGSKPVCDAKAYPKLAEVKKLFDSNHAAILKWLESAPDSALSASLKDKTGGFADDAIDGMMKLAWHEGWHFGQVASARKALGLKPVMG